MGQKDKEEIVRWEDIRSKEHHDYIWEWNKNRAIRLGKSLTDPYWDLFQLVWGNLAADRLRELWYFRAGQKKWDHCKKEKYSYRQVAIDKETGRVSSVMAVRHMAKDGLILTNELYGILIEDDKINKEKK